MSNTPICDFVRRYNEEKFLRLHMPGHKGEGPLGVEALDITEISGADSLYEAEGIIRQSEEIASEIFGCRTYYSAEGSSLAIRAMLYLALMQAKKQGRAPLVAAGRNAHKTFMSAAALLDIDIMWLWGSGESYLACQIEAESLDKTLSECTVLPFAVYITSPDYLGNTLDIASLAKVCRKYGVLLLVDNAHGAYLKFLGRHPIELGANMCCDSAHKTLGVLTGGAYLHIDNEL
ncbi:MAG: PLP-dependent transferase, partial [Oscillospiraceae bacterium]|nr:PLP-dependent transferase [Oscillospiraceae bacterium]